MRNRFASAYSGIQIDDGFAKQLRRGVAGQMSDGELALQSKRCAAPTFCLTM